jgi:hypothetical protein
MGHPVGAKHAIHSRSAGAVDLRLVQRACPRTRERARLDLRAFRANGSNAILA